jgi:serine/threonine protein kinase
MARAALALRQSPCFWGGLALTLWGWACAGVRMLKLPRSFGPYQLVRRLGVGGMAEVHLGVAFGASGFEKRVAIKSLLPELRGNGELERLLIAEALLGAKLQHRNLVQVHDLGVEEGAYYVRMDYVDGDDLGSLIRYDRPSAALSLLIAEEIALALDYVHEVRDEGGRALGLIHRDISPSNILISRAGEVKLADFGVAKATSLADVTGANVRKGKYAYMSPEQLAGAALSPQSDLFSLGVTLAQLLTGRRPFDGESVLETMEQIREARPPALEDVRQDMRLLLLRCLQREPERRPASARALVQELAALRRSLPPVGPPELAAWVRRWAS